LLVSLRPAEVVVTGPPIHREHDVAAALAIRFHNVAVAGRSVESTRVQLCGRLAIEIGGIQLAERLRGRQVRLLLAYLLLNRQRQVGREELMGAVWPDQAPVSQDAAMRTLLSRLRSALGGSALIGRDELMLALPEPVWVDLEAAATELQRAVGTLERGDPRGAWALAQVPLNIAARGLLPGVHASWLEPPRRELEDIRLRALEVVGEAGLKMGGAQLTSVERAGRSLIDAEPYRESGYVLLIEALAAHGNVAEAMRVFERLRTLLRDELGTVPSRKAIAVHERLLRPAAEAAVAEPGERRLAELELPAELRARSEQPLVGRRQELGELTRLWEAGAREDAPGAGHGPRIVFMAGEAGIGKTRLAAELARRVHEDGGTVLAGRAPREALVSYQPFLEALRHYFRVAPATELRASISDFGPVLSRLVPELRRRIPDLPEEGTGDPEGERYRLFEAVVGLLSAVSVRSPVLLLLDDLHWADRPSLLLLRHLARAPQPARLLILIAYRTEAAGAALSDVLPDLRREGLIEQIDVAGLSRPETAELVRARAGEPPSHAFAHAVYAATEGNPLFIEEIVRHLADAGVRPGTASASALQGLGLPDGVKEMIGRRLTQLAPQTVEWLRVAAVVGRDFDPAFVEQLLGFDEEAFLTALDEALSSGLILERSDAIRERATEGGRYSFSHPLVGEAVYEGMSAQRRQRLHARVGEALERTGRAPVSALAHHFTRAAAAADAEQAVAYAARAGDEATALLAHEDAAEHYSRAVEVLTRFAPEERRRRCELLLAVGEARARSGQRVLARAAFREAAVAAEELGDRVSLARAAIGASQRYVQAPGQVDTELIAMLRRALEVTDGQVDLDRVKLLARLCGAIYYAPDRQQMKDLSEEAIRIARRLGDPEALAYARAALRRALWDPSHLTERLAASTEMLTYARRAENLELQLQAHAWLVVDLLERGDRAAVEAQMATFSAGAEELRQPLYLWQARVWRATSALLEGRLAEAEELAADALAAGGPAEEVTAGQYYAIQLLATRREQARMGELEAAARQMVQGNPGRPAWRAALVVMLCESDQLTRARGEFEELAAEGFGDIPHDGDWLATMTLLCDACVVLRDARHAGELYDQLRPYGEVNVVAGIGTLCFGSASRYLGKLAATMGRTADAEEYFERAMEANAALRSPVLLAHTQLDQAASLGPGARARGLIDEAAETAERLGLTMIARRAAALRAT
jgi:predicted ATPase/DNA-binding SARP family transcriptional activator